MFSPHRDIKDVVLATSLVVVIDFDACPIGQAILPPGNYTVEVIANPTGLGVPWWVLVGTRTGISEPLWQECLDRKGQEQ